MQKDTMVTSGSANHGKLQPEKTGQRATLSGMQAAAYAAYALSEVATIFPITPASHMSEQVESWAVAGKVNLLGQPVVVKEMQSEKGAAGALHGALSGGALASTFTASQGLMLMIPNMYKISGELLPGIFHITCRSLSAHALSIFGDHQDLMAVRATGVAMLGSASVQECMDLSLVAHLSAIDGSLPFVHFFDGFRTSDEIETIEIISQEDMGKMLNWENVRSFRERAMDPLHPEVRGTAQNSDVYFQNREAPNRFYDALPQIVQANMDKVSELTGRSYHLFDYAGAPDAERVIVTMGSSCDVASEAANWLAEQGEKVGVVKVRLYRPFDASAFLSAVPKTCKVLCALDRTKEPGSQGEPLLQDICMAVLDAGRVGPDGVSVRVIGGRYGLSSKDFTPTDVKTVFDNMKRVMQDERGALKRFTVGITDDLTHLSLPPSKPITTLPPNMNQSVFYGFGSDGTVGANKQAARLLGEHADKWVQEYSWFDSKKSGGLTISYLRLSDEPVHSPYLITNADYVACHKDIYVTREYPMADSLRQGGVFVLNSRWTLSEMEKIFPASFKRALAKKQAQFYNIDAAKLAESVGLGSRINMIMEAVFLKLSGVIDFEKAIEWLKQDITVMYASKGQSVIEQDIKAVDGAISAIQRIDYPKSWAEAKSTKGETDEPDVPATAYDPQSEYITRVFWPMERLEGNSLPTSAMDPAGFTPLGGTAHEKRRVAFNVPEWDPNHCVQCYQCSFVCPHAAIRPYLATDEELQGAPDSYVTIPAKGAEELKELHFRIQNYPEDCVGCGSCAYNCPAPGKALYMKPIETQLPTQKPNLQFAQENISIKDNLVPKTNVRGTQLQQPLLEFSSACAGCGETPHVKLLTQLFGDRLIIANATGCSSIWGGYAPAMPYCKNMRGHGPAWGNSLFEDNAEYGYGIMKAVKARRQELVDLVKTAIELPNAPTDVNEVLNTWLENKDDAETSLSLGEAACAAMRSHTTTFPVYREILENSDMFQKKSIWAVGGDGWAFDIDYGGLDEVLASGENINVLVLDTEGYSNTGGEMSKATQLGSVNSFALNGKQTPKKRLARMAMQYDYVYVAQVCFGADMQQVITALREAEAYDGPSLVVALCPCISWGIKEGMSTVVGACRSAVQSGYWSLWRFNPDLAKAGKDPLIIDSKHAGNPEIIEKELRAFLMGQNRFASLADRKPALSDRLQSELAKERQTNYEELVSFQSAYKGIE